MTSVPGWESLRAADAIARLPGLSDDELRWVEARESGAAGRVTVLRAAQRTLSGRGAMAAPRPRVNPRQVKDI
jgi:hypothetical protein